MYFTRKYRLLIWGISISECILLVIVSILYGLYVPVPPYYIPLNLKFNNVIALCLIVALLPPSIAEYSNLKYMENVDRQISAFIRDMASGVSSDLTLLKAMEKASETVKGPLEREVKNLLRRFMLGESFSKATSNLGERLRTAYARQLSSMIALAYEAGARMPEIMSATEAFFTTISEYKDERSAKMRPYLCVFYLATIMSLIVSYFSLNSFLIPLIASPITFLPVVRLSPDYLKSLFFYLSMVESIFSGLLGGKISNGRLVAGLPHALILTILTLIFFNLLVF